jgi:hypothetical protein
MCSSCDRDKDVCLTDYENEVNLRISELGGITGRLMPMFCLKTDRDQGSRGVARFSWSYCDTCMIGVPADVSLWCKEEGHDVIDEIPRFV